MTPRLRELSRIRAEYDRVNRMSDEEYADACKRANTSAKIREDLMDIAAAQRAMSGGGKNVPISKIKERFAWKH